MTLDGAVTRLEVSVMGCWGAIAELSVDLSHIQGDLD